MSVIEGVAACSDPCGNACFTRKAGLFYPKMLAGEMLEL
jgi:hypothetical protein